MAVTEGAGLPGQDHGPTDDGLTGVWLCYNSDGSGYAVFPTEVEALRYAVSLSMQVKFQHWGEVIP